jgi:hypothetical protein
MNVADDTSTCRELDRVPHREVLLIAERLRGLCEEDSTLRTTAQLGEAAIGAVLVPSGPS